MIAVDERRTIAFFENKGEAALASPLFFSSWPCSTPGLILRQFEDRAGLVGASVLAGRTVEVAHTIKNYGGPHRLRRRAGKNGGFGAVGYNFKHGLRVRCPIDIAGRVHHDRPVRMRASRECVEDTAATCDRNLVNRGLGRDEEVIATPDQRTFRQPVTEWERV